MSTNLTNATNVNAPQTALVPVLPSTMPHVPIDDDEQYSQSNVSYKSVDVTKIGYTTPAAKEAKGKDQNGRDTVFKYFETRLNYNYGTETTYFDVEWDEPVEFSGISYNNGKPSMMARFKNNDGLVKFHDNVYMTCARIIDTVKGTIGKSTFMVSNPEACGFKPINFYKTDAGKRIDNSKPTHFLKLLNGRIKTLFTDLKGNPVDWKFLHNVDATLVAKVRYSHIFSNTTQIMVKVVLLSAFILDIQRVNVESTQKFSMGRFIKQNPNSVKKLEEQLQKIKLYAENDSEPTLPSGPKEAEGKEKSGSGVKDDKAMVVAEKTLSVPPSLPPPSMSHQMHQQQQYGNYHGPMPGPTPSHMPSTPGPMNFPPPQYPGHQGHQMHQPYPATPGSGGHQYLPAPGSVQQYNLHQSPFSAPSNTLQ